MDYQSSYRRVLEPWELKEPQASYWIEVDRTFRSITHLSDYPLQVVEVPLD